MNTITNLYMGQDFGQFFINRRKLDLNLPKNYLGTHLAKYHNLTSYTLTQYITYLEVSGNIINQKFISDIIISLNFESEIKLDLISKIQESNKDFILLEDSGIEVINPYKRSIRKKRLEIIQNINQINPEELTGLENYVNKLCE